MKKEIKLSLVYRDMWQAAGKYVPRVDQLVRVAEPIIAIGCFDRVETNGGGFEQVNLLFGENPNISVRQWTAPFNKAGIQTHMLERGLNGIRMRPISKDLRKLFFKVKTAQGTNISRSFDGLNNPQNLELSFKYAREAGMISQGAISLTYSKIHTVDYYIDLADKFIELGAMEICVKDMAGVGRPVSVGKIVNGIRKRHPNILIQYHGHTTPGLSVASSLEAAKNGADFIDVGMDPLSWGTGHADLITIHAMLEDAGFTLKEYDMDAYLEVKKLTQEFIDDFLGFYINPSNRFLNSLMLKSGLPGGMMGSLMADLENNLKNINKYNTKHGKPQESQDGLLMCLLKEVEFVWPQLGYPPLVTPYSQYVKNVAMMNVMQMAKGKDRWSMIDENTWNLILGRSGQLPAPLGDDILQLAKEQGRVFFEGNPQKLYPDELELFAARMDQRGWDYGDDDEELMQYAMHPQQYEDYRSGKAKKNFLADLEKRKLDAGKIGTAPTGIAAAQQTPFDGKSLNIEVNGEQFHVKISYGDESAQASDTSSGSHKLNGKNHGILSPLEGTFFLTKDPKETPIKVGDRVSAGDTIAYIESMKVINAISADKDGVVADILFKHGDDIEEDDVILLLK